VDVTANQSDLIESIAGILWRQHTGRDGLAEKLRRAWHRDDRGRVAKACGVSPEMLTAWERGLVRPTTQQTLAWLSYLYDSAPVHDPEGDAARRREEAREASEKWHADRRKQAASAGPSAFTVDLGRLPAEDRQAVAGQLRDMARRSQGAPGMRSDVYEPFVTALAEAAAADQPTAVDVGELLADDRKQMHQVLDAAAGRAVQSGLPAAADGMRLLSAAWERFTYGPDGEPAAQRARRR